MIQVLPDSVANQIAAGEVVQRPASVVKELLENAVDAGATAITLVVKDAGRTQLSVIDNGCGMTPTDARLAFERHATSKIRQADDLFALASFGFRGEALPSIASISEVELKTRRAEDETGTQLLLGPNGVDQQVVSCPVGTQIWVNNLFYNVPARRKFLKNDSVELKHIVNEFQRVALCYPEIAFSLINQQTELYNLPKSNYRQRIVHLFGKNTNTNLLEVSVSTGIVQVKGYIGKPENAKKTGGEQFFFVNRRYFKSAYFQKAVYNAYEGLLPQGLYPSYFLYFEIDPSKIDVNIHPTKTEIKFEEEPLVWQILHAAVRETIAKYAVAPAIDFDTEGAIPIPVLKRDTAVNQPVVEVDRSYNPFKTEKSNTASHRASFEKVGAPEGWESLYEGVKKEDDADISCGALFSSVDSASGEYDSDLPNAHLKTEKCFMQLKGKYVLTPVKSGLMVIDQQRAHRRILYEKFKALSQTEPHVGQTELFPQTVELNPADYVLLQGVLDELPALGFDVRPFGNSAVVVYAFPAESDTQDAQTMLEDLIQELKKEETSTADLRRDNLARAMANAAAYKGERVLSGLEMQHLVDQLFACAVPNQAPDGKPCLFIMPVSEFDKKLMK